MTDGENAVFETPAGYRIALAPKCKRIRGNAATSLIKQNVREGLEIDEETAPTWNGDRFDLHYTMYLLMQQEQKERPMQDEDV
jgi:hypothetical protein